MDDVLEPPPSDIQLARVLAALADANRLAAVRFVARNGESWCAQVREQAILRILREAGVISKRIEGAKGFMCLRKQDLDARFPGLMDSIVTAPADAVPVDEALTGPARLPA